MKATLAENAVVPGATVLPRRVTREMVRSRTIELALFAGRNSHQIKQVDYEQAKRELTGVADFDLQQAILDCMPYD